VDALCAMLGGMSPYWLRWWCLESYLLPFWSAGASCVWYLANRTRFEADAGKKGVACLLAVWWDGERDLEEWSNVTAWFTDAKERFAGFQKVHDRQWKRHYIYLSANAGSGCAWVTGWYEKSRYNESDQPGEGMVFLGDKIIMTSDIDIEYSNRVMSKITWKTWRIYEKGFRVRIERRKIANRHKYRIEKIKKN
jgi:hypothetical protein